MARRSKYGDSEMSENSLLFSSVEDTRKQLTASLQVHFLVGLRSLLRIINRGSSYASDTKLYNTHSSIIASTLN